ncbi:transglycosylase SLT domain-containing protein [Candidatus Margulisiibacteriota bacterium]
MRKIIILWAVFIFLFFPVMLSAATAYQKALDYYYQDRLDYALAFLSKSPNIQNKTILTSLIYLKQNKLSQARKYLAKVKTNNIVLNDYVKYIDLKISLLEGNFARASKIADYIHSSDRSPYLDRKIKLEFGWYYLRKKEYSKLQKILDHLDVSRKNTVFYSQVQELKIEKELQHQNLSEALVHYGNLIKEYPFKDHNQRLWKKLERSFHGRLQLEDCFASAKAHFDYVENLFEAKAYDQAEKQVRLVQQGHPDVQNKKELYYFLGKIYFNQYRYRKAIPVLRRALNYTTSLSTEKEIRYYLATSYQKLNKQRAALAQHLKIIEQIRKDPYEALALFNICNYYSLNGPYHEYKKYYDLFITEFESSPAAMQLAFQSQWHKITVSSSPKKVRSMLKALLPDNLYFKLMIFYKKEFPKKFAGSSRKDYVLEGVKQFPLSFRAYNLLKNTIALPKNKVSLTKKSGIWKKYKDLYQAGLGKLALEEADYLYFISSKKADLARYLFVRVNLLTELNMPYQSLAILEKNATFFDFIYGKIKPEFTRDFYPLEYWSLIKKYAKKYRVDPFFLITIIREESHFKADSVSSDGSLGLMHIAPITAADIAYMVGKPWSDPSVLFDIETNIKFGSYYLGWLKRMFKGDFLYMACGYNAGPGNTKEWIGSLGMADADVFIKNIKYTETREYVKKARETYLIYKLLY